MKPNHITPTAVERILDPDRYIISTTDTQGRITSVNDVLVETSGYSREELLQRQHNILRHPDMPRAVFWLAWDTLQAGEDFHGYFKNLCKDGAYYWVFAHIRPEHDGDGSVVGYRSVRRVPKRSAVATLSGLYAEMLAAEHAAGPKDAIPAGLTVLRQFLAKRNAGYEQVMASL